MELNYNVTESQPFKKEESRSRKMEHTKIETLNEEEHHSEADEEDPEAQELKVLISQIPGDNDELMSFTQNLKLEEYPTEFLVELADKLKKRRENLYSDHKKSEESERKNIMIKGTLPNKK